MQKKISLTTKPHKGIEPLWVGGNYSLSEKFYALNNSNNMLKNINIESSQNALTSEGSFYYL